MHDSIDLPKGQALGDEMQGELRAKTQEMLEMLFGHHGPKGKAIIIEHFRGAVEERVRAFYAEHGQWPVFKTDPDGRGLVMGTKEEIDPLRPCLDQESTSLDKDGIDDGSGGTGIGLLPPRPDEDVT